jgi:hypothetical protein
MRKDKIKINKMNTEKARKKQKTRDTNERAEK